MIARPNVQRWIRILLSIGLLLLVIALADGREVWRALTRVHPGWLMAAAAVAGVDRMIIIHRWQLLLAGRGIRLTFRQLTRVQLRAAFMGSFLPTSIGVDAIRMATLCRSGHSGPDVVAATLLDRMSLIIGTLVVGAATCLLLARELLPAPLQWAVLEITLATLIMIVSFLHPAMRRWCRLTLLPWVPSRFRQAVHDTARALLLYRHERRLLGAVAVLTGAALVVRIVFVGMIALAVGRALPPLGLVMVVPPLWIIGMLPITVGGLGVQDVGYVAMMGLIGVSAPLAVSMSVVEHLLARLGNLPGALLMGDAVIPGRFQASGAPQAG